MLRKKTHVVRKKTHVVRNFFYVASIFYGAPHRQNRCYVISFVPTARRLVAGYNLHAAIQNCGRPPRHRDEPPRRHDGNAPRALPSIGSNVAVNWRQRTRRHLETAAPYPESRRLVRGMAMRHLLPAGGGWRLPGGGRGGPASERAHIIYKEGRTRRMHGRAAAYAF